MLEIELLYFEGCPSYRRLLPRLRHLVNEAGGDPAEIVLRAVETAYAAEKARFLGSPTVRVDGRDVDVEAGERQDYGVKCRLYRTDEGLSPFPPDAWIRRALRP
jgi:hypothetical protein